MKNYPVSKSLKKPGTMDINNYRLEKKPSKGWSNGLTRSPSPLRFRLQECEEYTTWANEQLKKLSKFEPITDLRKTISDGETLAKLLEIISGEKIIGIRAKPIIYSQRLDNTRKCLKFLSLKGSQIQNISAEDVVNGNLTTTLNLLNEIRETFKDKEANNNKDNKMLTQNSASVSTQSEEKGIQSFNPTSAKDLERHHQEQMLVINSPGISIITSTDSTSLPALTIPGVTSISIEDVRQVTNDKPRTRIDAEKYVLEDKKVVLSSVNTLKETTNKALPQKPNVNSSIVSPQPKPKPAQAWTSAANKSPSKSRNTPSIEEQLKSLINDGNNEDVQYNSSVEIENGELLQVPPPKIWMQQQVRYSGVDSSLVNIEMKHNPNRNFDDFGAKYVPSQTDEKIKGPRGQALLERHQINDQSPPPKSMIYNKPTLYNGHDSVEQNHLQSSTNSFGSRQPSETIPASSREDLRDLCNIMFPVKQQQKLSNQVHINTDSTTTSVLKKPPSYDEHIYRHGHKVQISPGTPPKLPPGQLNQVEEISNSSAHFWSIPAEKESLENQKTIEERDKRIVELQKKLSNLQTESNLGEDNDFIKPRISSRYLTNLPSTIKAGKQKNKSPSQSLRELGLDLDLDYVPSECSSAPHTPQLPALSPNNTPPQSPPNSPLFPKKLTSQVTNNVMDSASYMPELIKYHKTSGGRPKDKNSQTKGGKKKTRRVEKLSVTTIVDENAKSSPYLYSEPYHGIEVDSSENTVDEGVTSSDFIGEGSDQLNMAVSLADVEFIRSQLISLEKMYQELTNSVGLEKQSKSTPSLRVGSRRSLSSLTRSGRSKGNRSSRHHRDKDIRSISRRFARVESHVVTLARSVAEVRSQMHSQSSLIQEINRLRAEVQKLQVLTNRNGIVRWRPVIPPSSNPIKLKKLKKFFGEEPPLLSIFLKQLGYEKYVPIFNKEKIGMVELPYIDENKLESIGIPIGPRCRIMHEAQLIV